MSSNDIESLAAGGSVFSVAPLPNLYFPLNGNLNGYITNTSSQILLNPKTVVSGTLSNVTSQANITPNVYNLTAPVTARYWRFDALSGIYPLTATNSVGLDEIQLWADVEIPPLTIKPAIESTWPVSPFPLMTSSNLLSATNWVPVEGAPVWNANNTYTFPGAPTASGTNFTLFEPVNERAAYFALPGPANGQTVSTNVARGGSVIYTSSTYTGPPAFPGSCLIDGITDESTNVCAIQPPIYWLGASGDTNASFVLDLQREYSITSVSLFNTHNGSCNDRDTAQFVLNAIDGISTTTNVTVVTNAVDRYYPMGGDLTDHSGNGVDATLLDGPSGNVISGTYTSNVPAVLGSGQSLVLTGNGDRVEIVDSGTMTEPTAYTMSAWVNFSDVSKPQCILVRTAGSGSESNTYSHELRVLPTGQFEQYTWIGSAVTVIGTTVVQPNTWYHVVGTAENGGLAHLYVNGKEEGTPGTIGTLWAGGDRWTMGSGSGDGSGVVPGFGPLLGEVTSLALWFSAITADEVEQLYTGTKPNALKQGTNTTITTQYLNPRQVASGTLSDVTGQVQITPDVFTVSPPVTARYLEFQALTSNYTSGNVGLNEIEVFAPVGAGKESISSRALFLSWPYTLLNVVLQSSPDQTTWTTVSAQPTRVGETWQLFQPNTGLYYRLNTQ